MFEYFPSIWNEKSSEFSYHFSETPFPGLGRADLRDCVVAKERVHWEREDCGQNNNYESMTEQKIAETDHQKDLHFKVQTSLTRLAIINS